jgi:insertion element IS1 protein InsB
VLRTEVDLLDKKRPHSCQRFRETVIPPDATDAEATVLELDELWSFVLKKTKQAWIWIALCRKTRPVVAYASREIEVKRPAAVCGKLFLKQARGGHCYTDFWSAYQAVILEEQYAAVGKETGETARARALE